MNSSYNQYRGLLLRRNQRLEKQDRKFTPEKSLKIKAKYRSEIRKSKPLTRASLKKLRAKIIANEKKRIQKQWIILVLITIIISSLMSFLFL